MPFRRVEPAISGKEWSMAANCGGFGGGSSLVDILQYDIWQRQSHDRCQRMCPVKTLRIRVFEELQAEFERQIKHYLDYQARLYHFAAVFNHEWPCLSASVMTEGCIESGKDVTWRCQV